MLRQLSKIVVDTYSFHHGGFFFPPWWKEKTSMVERISIRMEKTNRWKGKSIVMPKNGVSYCI
ncbi:hypothetical protein DW712_07975 [Bacteroides intestinalis]|uniref:Uncharacterized protein n=1 Tax=Bacteroides intestinalis TaxID=329854 RepID=A0A414LDZ2_9BACE|nr:hypothetical protein DW712_07975 [Bacteroides intestinalis]